MLDRSGLAKRMVAIFAAAVLLSGCASPASLQYLADTQVACNSGDRASCSNLAGAHAWVDNEKAASGAAIGVGILAVLAGAADAYADSRQPTYVIVRRCRFC